MKRMKRLTLTVLAASVLFCPAAYGDTLTTNGGT